MIKVPIRKTNNFLVFYKFGTANNLLVSLKDNQSFAVALNVVRTSVWILCPHFSHSFYWLLQKDLCDQDIQSMVFLIML